MCFTRPTPHTCSHDPRSFTLIKQRQTQLSSVHLLIQFPELQEIIWEYAKGCLPFFVVCSRGGKHSKGKAGAAWPVSRAAGHVFVVVFTVQRGQSPYLRLFLCWHPLSAAIREKKADQLPFPCFMTHHFSSWNIMVLPRKCQTGDNTAKRILQNCQAERWWVRQGAQCSGNSCMTCRDGTVNS